MITRPIIIHEKKGETIEQKVTEVHKDHILVTGISGKTYRPQVSSKIKLELVKPNDTAIIDVDTWKVIEILKKEKPPVLTEEEEDEELQRQLDELMDMGYDY